MAAGSPEDPVRVLVVDDSPVSRRVIISQLSRDSCVAVVGEAQNGIEALKKVLELKPDLVTIDIQMPVMNGLKAIEQIMMQAPVPILVLTALDDAETAFAALAKGALEVMEKPRIDRPSIFLAGKVRVLAGVKVVSPLRRDRIAREPRTRGERTPSTSGSPRRVVAIASSTGGPKALSVILSSLPADLRAPVLVAQHMSDGFTEGMVHWLNTNSRLAVHTAVHGEVITEGRVYVCPSELNMSVTPSGEILLSERRRHDIYRPCCDVLLESVADVYGSSAIGVILTGMGNDGASGIARIREAGGVTIAQDESSSVIFGMPRAAIEKGCVTIVLPLDKIAAELVKRLWFDCSASPRTDGSHTA
jgi:two-component system, chemotaxis family, protein-glutamate methylesterase/glutaminase